MSIYSLGYNVAKSVARLPGIIDLIERIKKSNKVDYKPEVTFGNIDDIIADCGQYLFEVMAYYHENDMRDKFRNQESILNIARTRVLELKKKRADVIEYLESLVLLRSAFSEEYRDYNDIWTWNFEPTFRHTFNSCLETEYKDWVDIFKKIRAPRPLNILEVNTDFGGNLLKIKEVDERVNLYAVSHRDDTRGKIDKEKRQKFERFVVGGLNKVVITNDAFDIVYCQPCIDLETDFYQQNIIFEERKMLDRAYIYLRRGGILVYTIPMSRLSKQISLYLARGLKGIQVLSNELTEKTGAVTIIGYKPSAKERVLDAKIYVRLRNLYWTKDFDTCLMDRTVPSDMRRIEKFRGSKMDDAELQEAFLDSNAMKTFWKDQVVEKLSETKKKPLLPFTIGQLGLVLTSGCLDGVVEEEDGCAHCVKGRVVKVTETKRDFNEDGNTVDIVETTRNRVEISMFLPDGSYRCLT